MISPKYGTTTCLLEELRNRVKRQVREAYRLNKDILLQALADQPHGMVLAFIWLDKELHSSEEIGRKMRNLLHRIAEKTLQL